MVLLSHHVPGRVDQLLSDLQRKAGPPRGGEPEARWRARPAEVLAKLLDLPGTVLLGDHLSVDAVAPGPPSAADPSFVGGALAERLERRRRVARRQIEAAFTAVRAGRARVADPRATLSALTALAVFEHPKPKLVEAAARQIAAPYVDLFRKVGQRSFGDVADARRQSADELRCLGGSVAQLLLLDDIVYRASIGRARQLFDELCEALEHNLTRTMARAIRDLPAGESPESLGPWFERDGVIASVLSSLEQLSLALFDSEWQAVRAVFEGALSLALEPLARATLELATLPIAEPAEPAEPEGSP